MGIETIAGLVDKYGFAGGIALLSIGGVVWLAFGLRSASRRIWSDSFPLAKAAVDRHIAFLDSTTDNMRAQVEATTMLTQKIERLGVGEKLDDIHRDIQAVLTRGCGKPQAQPAQQ